MRGVARDETWNGNGGDGWVTTIGGSLISRRITGPTGSLVWCWRSAVGEANELGNGRGHVRRWRQVAWWRWGWGSQLWVVGWQLWGTVVGHSCGGRVQDVRRQKLGLNPVVHVPGSEGCWPLG